MDYCIGTSSLLGLVDDFCVLEISSLFSDVHCPLSITLRSEHIIYSVDEIDGDTHTYEKPRKWDSSKIDDYCDNIKINIVHELHDQLSNMELNTIDVTFIDGLFDKLSNLFVTVAKHTFGTIKPEYRNTRKHTQ